MEAINKKHYLLLCAGLSLATVFECGCGTLPKPERIKSPSITARPASPANRCEPAGFPFYLPKPLLVVSKNFHHIAEPKVGLTVPADIPDSFDEQETFGTVNSSSTMQHGSSHTADANKDVSDAFATAPSTVNSAVPPSVSPGFKDIPKDGLAPHTFFTYEIVFVPDLTQKYVLQVEGGAGEIRAALNLVNGWQFTGLGPYYMKDSSTAQNLLARGLAFNMGLSGAADVVNSTANLVSKAAPNGVISPKDLAEYTRAIGEVGSQETFDFKTIPAGVVECYAEIFVYEASVGPDGQMQWRQIVGEFDDATQQFLGHRFNREYLGVSRLITDPKAAENAKAVIQSLPQLQATSSRATDPGIPRDSFSQLPQVEPNQHYGQILDRTLTPPATVEKEHGVLHDLFHHRRPQVNNQTVNVVP